MPILVLMSSSVIPDIEIALPRYENSHFLSHVDSFIFCNLLYDPVYDYLEQERRVKTALFDHRFCLKLLDTL